MPLLFIFVVTPKEGWIDGLTVRQAAPPTLMPAPASISVSRAVPTVEEGDMLPDYRFTNELGQSVNLSQYKGQPIAFTFFFTSCPYPNFCPRLTGNFAEAATQLRQMPNGPKKWHLFSISFDPRTDTPSHLLNYAKGARITTPMSGELP